MSSNFCVYCGQHLEGNDKFCYKCGATVQDQKVVPSIKNPDNRLHSNSLTTPIIDENKRSSSKNLKLLILIPIILFSIALPFIILSSLGAVRSPLGTLDYEINSMDYLDVELVIDNSVGLIEITFDDSMDALFEATIEVRGGIKASLEDAKNFQHNVINNKTIITFNSEDEFLTIWNFKTLTHNLYISLHPDTVTDFSVCSSVGSVSLDLDSVDNLVMKDVDLSSSTGSVNFCSGNTINTTMEDIILSTNNGRILFNFDDAFGTTVNEIVFEDSTGNIIALLGEALNIESTDIVMLTSTGSIELTFEDILFNEDTNWLIETSTGYISIEFIQNINLPANFTAVFNVETSTGSITIDGDVASDVGIEAAATTNTGSISFPSESSQYTSENFYLKNNRFSFTLVTSTGSITANFEN